MREHTKVRTVAKISPSRWDLELVDGTVVRVFITDVYTFSASDYARLRVKFPDVNCIASASNWNHFSSVAEEDAVADGIETVHLGGELMSAIHGFLKDRRAQG